MGSHEARTPQLKSEDQFSRKKKEIVDRSLAHFQVLLDTTLGTNLDTTLDRSIDKSLKRSRTKKRSWSHDEDEESSDNDQERVRIMKLGQAKTRFPCPFAKVDPERYKSENICWRSGWTETHRVKEHIYRRHALKSRCSRCFEHFDDEDELRKHQRSETPRNLEGRYEVRKTGYSKYFTTNPYPGTEGKGKQRYIPSLHGLKRREAPGTVNDIPVNAVPDYGSSIDAISEGFAREHGMEIRSVDKMMIKLPGGGVAESVGLVIGDFRFQGENQIYTRHFRVLGKCEFDMVLGRDFLELTKTLTDFCHRIVERFRPCVQNGGRLFLLDESPKDRIRCTVNGSNASAFPDTGSDLMLISGAFARRNNLEVHRGRKYRQQVELADGSTILTDGMVLGAELEFDSPPMSSPQEINLAQYLKYDRELTALMKERRGVETANDKSVFVCDLHVVDDLPCDIILSSDFIFENQVFSRFKHLFSAELAPISLPSHHASAPGDNMRLEDHVLFIRSTKKRSRSCWGRRRPPTPPPADDSNAVPLTGQSWEELWETEETRRNQMQLRIASLSDPLKAEEQRAERQRQEDWDRNHPRPPPPMLLVLPSTGSGLGLD